MSVQAVFEKMREALEAAGIPDFVSGSFASSAHGIRFPSSDFAKDEEDAFEALKQQSQFQVIDYATMWKVDFMIHRRTPFDASRFARRQIVEIAGVLLQTASLEMC